MPGTFTERQEGQCCWREVGKGAGRLDGVSAIFLFQNSGVLGTYLVHESFSINDLQENTE